MQRKVDLSVWHNLHHDLPAGVVVFLVAVPLCLGIALASGAPLFSGIIAGIIGGLVVPFFSHSQLSVSGPAAGLTAIVLLAIQQLGSFEAFLLAAVLAGLFQIALGALRAGAIAYFVPNSVIKGMLAAIGLIIILKQLPHAIGYDAERFGLEAFKTGEGETTLTFLAGALTHIHPGALIISLVSLAILIVWDRIAALRELNWLPCALVAVIAGTLLNLLFQQIAPDLALTQTSLVTLPVFDSLDDFFVSFRFPDWSQWHNQAIYSTALTIGIVASLESLLSVEAIDRIDPFRRRTPLDRELVSQGVGNTLCGLLGGLPITAVIVRSSANISAGGRTKAAAVFHGLLLLLATLFLAEVLNLIPLATLASILLVVGYKLAKPALFRSMLKLTADQSIPFMATVAAILLTNLLEGVGIGLLVGVFFVLKTNFHAAVSIAKEGKKIVLALNKDVSFINKATLSHILERIPDKASLIIDGTEVEFIDHDMLEVIRDFEKSAYLREITVEERGFNRPVLLKTLQEIEPTEAPEGGAMAYGRA